MIHIKEQKHGLNLNSDTELLDTSYSHILSELAKYWIVKDTRYMVWIFNPLQERYRSFYNNNTLYTDKWGTNILETLAHYCFEWCHD